MTNNTAYLYPIDTRNQEPIILSEFFTIGKESMPQHSLSHELAERQCRLERRDNGYLLRDLRSGTPTLVNDTQVGEALLKENDEITVGNLNFVFSYEPPTEISSGLKSKNEKWEQELQSLPRLARTPYPILILGPSGTGKEILAQTIHRLSDRAAGPLVSVNCCALTETLIESELFGHTKGSFTGAIANRAGAFETARGGTLFLDEIGDLPYGLQAKLLRALESQEIRPVGSDDTIQTNIRVIAATHQNLAEKIRMGQFRADLYYRLNVISVTPPALCERMEDFEDLLYTFAKEMRVRFSFCAIRKLKQQRWTGNIRELRNTVARASALFARQTVGETDVDRILDPMSLVQPDGQMHVPGTLPVIREIEREMIIKRLEANNGNQRRTASDLNIPKSTLHDRIKAYNINPKLYAKSNS